MAGENQTVNQATGSPWWTYAQRYPLFLWINTANETTGTRYPSTGGNFSRNYRGIKEGEKQNLKVPSTR
jgi:hypothetical protein